MMADVPTADVVLVNPTHVAVALTYDAERGAPRVVARGAGVVAAKIREQAAEQRRAARAGHPAGPGALHAPPTVGQEIPGELFAAVAQVLAFVISRRSAGPAGASTAPRDSESELPARARRRTSSPDFLRLGRLSRPIGPRAPGRRAQPCHGRRGPDIGVP